MADQGSRLLSGQEVSNSSRVPGSSHLARAGESGSCTKSTKTQKAYLYLNPGIGKEASFGLTAVLTKPGVITPAENFHRYNNLSCMVVSGEEKETYRCEGSQDSGTRHRITIIKETDSFRVVWATKEKNQTEFREKDWGAGFECALSPVVAQFKPFESLPNDPATAGASGPAAVEAQPLAKDAMEPLDQVDDVAWAVTSPKRTENRRLTRPTGSRTLRDADRSTKSRKLARDPEDESGARDVRVDEYGNFVNSDDIGPLEVIDSNDGGL